MSRPVRLLTAGLFLMSTPLSIAPEVTVYTPPRLALFGHPYGTKLIRT